MGLTIRLFSVISRTLVWGVLTLCRNAVSVFQNPRWLGLIEWDNIHRSCFFVLYVIMVESLRFFSVNKDGCIHTKHARARTHTHTHTHRSFWQNNGNTLNLSIIISKLNIFILFDLLLIFPVFFFLKLLFFLHISPEEINQNSLNWQIYQTLK